MAICTNHLALRNFFLYTIKPNSTSKPSYRKHLIIFLVVEIQNSWVSNSTSATPRTLLVFIDPLVIALYEYLFSQTIAIATFPTTIHLRFSRQSYSKIILWVENPTIFTEFLFYNHRNSIPLLGYK